jgi:hypothetical protein
MVTLGVLGVTSFTSAAQRRRSATGSGAEGVSQLSAGHFTPLQRADGEGESRVAGSASVVSGLVSQDAEAPASDEAEAKASMKDGETDPATEGEVAVDGDDLPPLQNAEGGMVDKPHLLWVVLDDVGFNDVGYASSDLGLATPFLDDLSNDGIRFSQLYGQPVCTPSRAAMLTGKLPIHLQLQHWQVVPTEPWGLPTQEVILPQYLRALGYKNLMFGKWHLGHFNNASTPRARGFDHFYGFYSGGVDYFTHVSEESCDTGAWSAVRRQRSRSSARVVSWGAVRESKSRREPSARRGAWLSRQGRGEAQHAEGRGGVPGAPSLFHQGVYGERSPRAGSSVACTWSAPSLHEF